MLLAAFLSDPRRAAGAARGAWKGDPSLRGGAVARLERQEGPVPAVEDEPDDVLLGHVWQLLREDILEVDEPGWGSTRRWSGSADKECGARGLRRKLLLLVQDAPLTELRPDEAWPIHRC